MILIRKLIHYTPRAYYIENEHSFVIFKTIHLADTFLTFISGLIVLVLTVKKVVFENNGICIRIIRCIKGILLILNIFLLNFLSHIVLLCLMYISGVVI